MTYPPYRRVVLLAAALGVVVPILLLVASRLLDFMFGAKEVAIWPSSIMLMANDGHEGTLAAYGVVAISIAINMIWYVLLGSVVWSLGWLIRRLATRKV